jgi:hypothetical protein
MTTPAAEKLKTRLQDQLDLDNDVGAHHAGYVQRKTSIELDLLDEALREANKRGAREMCGMRGHQRRWLPSTKIEDPWECALCGAKNPGRALKP